MTCFWTNLRHAETACSEDFVGGLWVKYAFPKTSPELPCYVSAADGGGLASYDDRVATVWWEDPWTTSHLTVWSISGEVLYDIVINVVLYSFIGFTSDKYAVLCAEASPTADSDVYIYDLTTGLRVVPGSMPSAYKYALGTYNNNSCSLSQNAPRLPYIPGVSTTNDTISLFNPSTAVQTSVHTYGSSGNLFSFVPLSATTLAGIDNSTSGELHIVHLDLDANTKTLYSGQTYISTSPNNYVAVPVSNPTHLWVGAYRTGIGAGAPDWQIFDLATKTRTGTASFAGTEAEQEDQSLSVRAIDSGFLSFREDGWYHGTISVRDNTFQETTSVDISTINLPAQNLYWGQGVLGTNYNSPVWVASCSDDGDIWATETLIGIRIV